MFDCLFFFRGNRGGVREAFISFSKFGSLYDIFLVSFVSNEQTL